jgi:hypothetical protein
MPNMTFDSYFRLIMESAREAGYDAFLPSLCSIEDGDSVMRVLECDISEEGDERVAKEWAATFMKDGRTVFLAYRHGHRIVSVVEYLGSESIQTSEFKLNPRAP